MAGSSAHDAAVLAARNRSRPSTSASPPSTVPFSAAIGGLGRLEREALAVQQLVNLLDEASNT
jgi:hypothetical protein